jgi:biotin carboxylase
MVKIKTMNILILGVGGHTPRSILKRLRTVYPNSRLIGTDINPKALGFHMKGLIDKGYLIPRATAKDYFNKISEIIATEQVDFAFVQPEQEVLAWGKYFEEYKTYPCATLIPPKAHVEALMDKAAMADLLKGTLFIPDTLRITPSNPRFEEVQKEIGYPCWIRASIGSGGLGSLMLNRKEELEAWLFIHKTVPEFTISKYLTGRHLANQMLYIGGQCVANAGLHCAEYVMADIAPSKVTGNTSYGLLLNEKKLLEKCEEVMDFVQKATGVKANGVYSFDFKEDDLGNLLVTEINIRHMAYTGILAECGFDLVSKTVEILQDRFKIPKQSKYYFDKEYVFLRDVDIEPIILNSPF